MEERRNMGTEGTYITKLAEVTQAASEALVKANIVADLAKKGTIKEIIHNIGGTSDEDLKDLEQDIYLDLLRKPLAQLNSLIEKGQLQFFLVRMIQNQIRSKNSPFYNKYKKTKEKNDRYLLNNGEIPADG